MLLLDEDNEAAGFVECSDLGAILDAPAHAVIPRSDLLVVDADDWCASERVGRLSRELRESGFNPVLIASGGEGRRHLFVRLEDRAVHQTWLERARALQCEVGPTFDIRRGKGGRIRPPGSRHRHGKLVRLVSHESWDDVVAALRAPGRPLKKVPARLRLLLRCRREKGTRSEAILSAALMVVNAGLSREWFHRAMSDPSNGLSEKLRDRSASARRAYVDRVLDMAEARVSDRPARTDDSTSERGVATIQQAVELTSWPGRGGRTERSLLLRAFLPTAKRLGSLEFGLDQRTMARLAGLSSPCAATKAARRLEASGWLVRTTRSRGRESARWRIQLPSGGTDNSPIVLSAPPTEKIGLLSVVDDHADAFRESFCGARGLGRLAEDVLRELILAGPGTAVALAKAGVGSLSGVQRALRVLEAHFLVVPEATCRGSCWAVATSDAAELAVLLGRCQRRLRLSAASEIQASIHRAERLADEAKLEDFAAMVLPCLPWRGSGATSVAEISERLGGARRGTVLRTLQWLQDEQGLARCSWRGEWVWCREQTTHAPYRRRARQRGSASAP